MLEADLRHLDSEKEYHDLSDFIGRDARDIEEFDRAASCREEGTAEWIFEEDKFARWCSSSDSSGGFANLEAPQILWVTGKFPDKHVTRC